MAQAPASMRMEAGAWHILSQKADGSKYLSGGILSGVSCYLPLAQGLMHGFVKRAVLLMRMIQQVTCVLEESSSLFSKMFIL